jgi:hypothetical protein
VTPLIITTGVRIDQASHDSPLESPMKNSACLSQGARSISGWSPV